MGCLTYGKSPFEVLYASASKRERQRVARANLWSYDDHCRHVIEAAAHLQVAMEVEYIRSLPMGKEMVALAQIWPYCVELVYPAVNFGHIVELYR